MTYATISKVFAILNTRDIIEHSCTEICADDCHLSSVGRATVL